MLDQQNEQLQLLAIPFNEGLWSTLEPIWKTLTAQTRETSVFLSPEWTAAWLAVFGRQLRPTALVWRRADSSPVACVLLSTCRARLGPFPVNRVYFNASGDRIVGAEHNDILVLDEFRPLVLRELLQHVRRQGPDEIALVGFRSEAADEIEQLWPTTGREGYVSEDPYVDLRILREAGKPYLSSLSSNSRSRIRKSMRLYEQAFGKPEARLPADAEEAKLWFDDMVKLHETRWEARGLKGAFHEDAAREFHGRVLRWRSEVIETSESPRMDLLRVRFGDETIGYLYNLVYRGRVNFYQSGLRYHGEDNRLKPGLVAHTLAIEHYLPQDLDEYDFLAGEPESVQYKRSLATGHRQLAWHQFRAPTWKMRLIDVLRRYRRRLKGSS